MLSDLFLPTKRNNYRARLLSMPGLLLFTLVIFVFNTFVAPGSVAAARADINQQNLLEVHNVERRKAGLAPLKINPALTASAQAKAQAMLETDCWSHYCPDGKSPWDFFTSAGYKYQVAGENLAEGFFNSEDVMVAWMNSPTHRENIVKAEYEEIGFGVVRGEFQNKNENVIIAVHFGTPRPSGNDRGAVVGSEADLPTPKITAPADGGAFNTKRLEVKGTAPESTQVTLYNQSQKWAVADANEGIFTYYAENLPEGNYSLTAIGQVGIRISNPSAPIKFMIDRTAEKLSNDQLLVTKVEGSVATVFLNANDLTDVKLLIAGDEHTFKAATEQIWSADIPKQSFTFEDRFSLALEDKAGNTWSQDFDTELIRTQIAQVSIPGDESGTPSSGRVISTATKANVNTVFLALMGSLFLLDFVILARSGITKGFAKTHLHFGLFFIVVLISITGGFSGQLLTGGISL